MKVLVINAGSSSLKFQLIETTDESVIAKGGVERIGLPQPFVKYSNNSSNIKEEIMIEDHNGAIQVALEMLTREDVGVINSLDEIDAVGHRTIHGGETYTHSVIITDEVLADFEASVHLAPLHFPPNILGMRASKKAMPNKTNVAVFDTAFHSSMPDKAYMYAIPKEMYTQHQIRKYGFHGSSHRYIAEEMTKILGGVEGTRIISCHLGNGSSICAIKDGKSIDTTMGYTPLEGLIMGTRSGDIDPTVVGEIMKYNNMNIDEALNYLNKKSGFVGLTGTSDLRDIREHLDDNDDCRLAHDMLIYRITKYIGAYMAALGGLDALVFTGGIGENSEPTRAAVCKALEGLGICMDYDKNDNTGDGNVELSTKDSNVKIYRIPTDEEMIIARDTAILSK